MGFWSRLFRQKPAPFADMRGGGEDFRVGDLAECIDGDFHEPHSYDPQVGDILRVSALVDGYCTSLRILLIGLRFEGKPQNDGWDRRCFRKVVIAHEPAEAEFTALIKRPARKPVRA